MKVILTVVAALLLGQWVNTNVAAAAETEEYLDKDTDASLKLKKPDKPKKTKKILAMLKSVGVSDPKIVKFVHQVDANIKDNKLMLYKEKITDGELSLRYDFRPEDGQKKLGLYYKPDDSNAEYRVNTNAIMVNYKLNF